MAGAIPPAHGGDRIFIEDPAKATNADAVGDLAAQLQAALHIVSNLAGITPAEVAVLGAIRERTNVTRDAAETLARRDRNQRNPAPLSDVPRDGGYGALPLGNSKFNHVTKFDGNSDDVNAVYVWLSSCIAVARAGTLSAEATLSMLLMTASGSAFMYLEDCRRKGMTLYQIAQAVEMRYGELCTPEEAKSRIHSYQRGHGASITKVSEDLKHLARLACRDDEAAVRNERMDELVRHNLLRVLPSHIGTTFTDELSRAVTYGGYLLSNDEIVAKAKQMEGKVKATSDSHDRPEKKRGHDRHHAERHHARQVTQTSRLEYSEEDVDDILAVAATADEGDEEEAIIDEILAVNEVFAAKNQKVSMPVLLSAAIKQHNKRQNFRPARVAGVSQPAQAGPPNKLARNQAMAELLTMAGVVRGECMHCGVAGHIKGNIKCQLRGLPLVDRPCIRCGKGLHSADQCPKVNANRANAVTEEDSLNEA